MTPTPPSSNTSNSGQSPDGQFRVVRKRNRIPLSCGPCRHRKLKCNRSHPCDNCIKRGDVDACTYAAPNAKRKNTSHNGTASGNPDEMQNRIDRLESLVLSLMTNGAQAAGPTAANAAIAGVGPASGSSIGGSSPRFQLDAESVREEPEDAEDGDESEVDKMSKQMGVMKMDSGKTIFASEAHWYSILAEIAEVKNHFAAHKKEFEEHYNNVKQKAEELKRETTSFFPFITEKPASHSEILAAFPNKQTTDVLISRFFNTHNYDPAFHIIHGPTYQRQYDQHWISPSDTPLIWLAMTYAMMSIAVQSFIRAEDGPPEYREALPKMLRDYRRLTAQCLILVDITAPITYMLETLLLCVISELGRTRDAETGPLLGVSVIVRLAMRMGYHRDSRDFPQVTPFQGEMRRRIWTVVRHCDLLFSLQAGLPPMIRPHDTNTAPPLNIYDDELSEEMKELPASRPLTETTPMTYIIYKNELINAYAEIVEAVQGFANCSYEQVMKMDHKLREIHANIPPLFRMRSMNEALRDSSAVVMQRYILDLLFLKSQCVLHRKFICPSRDSTRYVYSRRIAIDNAMEMLKHQATLHNESRPGGRLSSVKWFVSSLTSNDFLLAAMIVALDLYHTAEAERQGRRASNDLYDWSHERRTSMLQTLEQSRNIWATLQDQSMEALKAYGVLSAMLGKLQSHEEQLRRVAQAANFDAKSFHQNGTDGDDSTVAPEHSAAMTLGLLSSGAMTGDAANMFAQYSTPGQPNTNTSTSGMNSNFFGTADTTNVPMSSSSPFSSLFGPSSNMFNMDVAGNNGNNIDWDAWDSFLQNGNVNMDGTAGSTNTMTTPNMSSGFGMWPGGMNMNIDLPGMSGTNGTDISTGDVGNSTASQTQSPSQSSGNFPMVSNVYLGASTPRSAF
ncbi:uncharacterized protein PV09_04934 [Verruconis gallopava]|uniref:Zn(2)-C6 fungal-type domain-containing protein n=1 Tax=Verruconis gallopava TaxID=253628 RepID=A0A0D1XNH5_9PEZI|nr:uncharacterized protein PV09_04934 [Verruconis gallopava]KIW04126.1 hypothetical protein PV09_04934 [Verruconis gallopava]